MTNGVDSDKITISKIAVPLKTSTVIAAEVVGASLLIAILDVVLGKVLSVGTINQCIDDIIKFTRKCEMVGSGTRIV